MELTDRRIAGLRRSIWLTLWVRALVRVSALLLWVCGCGIMAARLLWSAPLSWTLWSLVVVPVAAIGCAVYASRRVPAVWMLRAAIDKSSQANGLLMADGEVSLENWAGRFDERAVRVPKISWDFRGALGMLSMAAVFAAVTLLLPSDWLRRPVVPIGPELDIARNVQQLDERLATLEEVAMISPEDAEVLREDLREVQRSAEGDNPAKTLETLDHVKSHLKTLAEEGAAEASETARHVADLADAAEALDQAAEEMDPAILEEAMEQLAKLTKQANSECQGISSDDLEKAAKLCENGLDAETLRELAETLKDCLEGNEDLLRKLAESGLIDPNRIAGACQRLTPDQIRRITVQLRKCQGGPCPPSEELEKLLEEAGIILGDCQGDEDGITLALALGPCLPGRGGVSRGPGAAVLEFDGETPEQKESFKNEILTPGGLDDQARSMRQAISRGGPGEDEQRELSAGGGLAGNAGSGGAHVRQILPGHRTVVQGYFGRDSETTPQSE